MLQATVPDLIDEPVQNPDAFYPDLNVKDWQETYRVPGTAPVTLGFQLRLALRHCNRALEPWKEEQIMAGIVELPAEHTDAYIDAVYARATALLIPLLPSIVTDERAREHIELLQQKPEAFAQRSADMLAQIRSIAVERIDLI